MIKISRLLSTTALVAALIAPAALVASVPAGADETGMAGIHSWRKVGKKTCLVGHQHSGAGSGQSKRAAEAQAVSSWASFTDLEYGSDWANINVAVEKIMRCGPSMGGFQCDLLATPCHLGMIAAPVGATASATLLPCANGCPTSVETTNSGPIGVVSVYSMRGPT
jgi:hypothetical protein